MKYLVVNGLDVNNRIAQEQGANGNPIHSTENPGGKVTQYWFDWLDRVDSNERALQIPDEKIGLLTESEQLDLITQVEFDALEWEIEEDGGE